VRNVVVVLSGQSHPPRIYTVTKLPLTGRQEWRIRGELLGHQRRPREVHTVVASRYRPEARRFHQTALVRELVKRNDDAAGTQYRVYAVLMRDIGGRKRVPCERASVR
jgi:hypothetical protein